MSWFGVGKLIFPADFYVLDMEEGFSHGYVPIILGKPFLKTARIKIDVYAGTLSMEFGDIVAHFNILDAMKHPSEDHFVFCAELIDDIVDEYILDSDSFHDKKHYFYLIFMLVCPHALNLIMNLIFVLRVFLIL